jgi:hypothetical protein
MQPETGQMPSKPSLFGRSLDLHTPGSYCPCKGLRIMIPDLRLDWLFRRGYTSPAVSLPRSPKRTGWMHDRADLAPTSFALRLRTE